MMDKCIIGDALGEDCNLISEAFNRKAGFYSVAELSPESQQLLTLRTGVSIDASENPTLCYYHEKKFISRYESLQKFCCDPFNKHKKRVTSKYRTLQYTCGSDSTRMFLKLEYIATYMIHHFLLFKLFWYMMRYMNY